MYVEAYVCPSAPGRLHLAQPIFKLHPNWCTHPALSSTESSLNCRSVVVPIWQLKKVRLTKVERRLFFGSTESIARGGRQEVSGPESGKGQWSGLFPPTYLMLNLHECTTPKSRDYIPEASLRSPVSCTLLPSFWGAGLQLAPSQSTSLVPWPPHLPPCAPAHG